jgi:hypothetical protein
MISDIKKRIKKIELIIKTRDALLDQEMGTLIRLKEEKNLALQNLNIKQNLYLKGLENLNIERTKPTRNILDLHEQNLDNLKNDWLRLHRESQNLEKKIRAQTNYVLQIKKYLEGVGKIKARYELDLLAVLDKKEQEFIDELSQRKIALDRKKTFIKV